MKHPYLLVCATLVAADQLLKQVLPTPYWGWDPRGFSAAAVGFGVAAAALLASYKPIRLGGTIMLAGITSNAVSASHGSVANPFVVEDVAFNAADLMLVCGLAVIFFSCPAVFRDVRARAHKNGRTW